MLLELSWSCLFLMSIDTDKSILDHVKPNQIWILITLFRLIWHKTEFYLLPDQLKKCEQNQNLINCVIHFKVIHVRSNSNTSRYFELYNFKYK